MAYSTKTTTLAIKVILAFLIITFLTTTRDLSVSILVQLKYVFNDRLTTYLLVNGYAHLVLTYFKIYYGNSFHFPDSSSPNSYDDY